MKPKRILLLDTGKEWGGGTNSMIELLKRIDRTRFAVSALFYNNYSKGGDSDLATELARINIPLIIEPPIKQPLWAKLSKEIICGLLKPFTRLRKKALFQIDYTWRIFPSAKKIAAHLHQGSFDMLYMNNQPSSNLEGYIAGEMAGVSVIQHCRIETQLNQNEVKHVNRIAQKIICVSQGVCDTLVQSGIIQSKCIVIYNAIDANQPLPPPKKLPLKENTVIIGSIGSLITRKANDHLLRAAAKLYARNNTPFHLLLIGEGAQRNALENLAQKLGLSSHVTFTGFQQSPLAWVSTMDIVVLSSEKEGLPRVILEAMLLSKPVIASDIVGSREIVKHHESGLLYPYADEEALTNCLQQLIEDKALRDKMGQSGRMRVLKEFAIENYVRGVEQVLLS